LRDENKKKNSGDKEEDPETRKKRKRLEKLDRKINGLSKSHAKEGVVKM